MYKIMGRDEAEVIEVQDSRLKAGSSLPEEVNHNDLKPINPQQSRIHCM
jgi:hypothetical protein